MKSIILVSAFIFTASAWATEDPVYAKAAQYCMKKEEFTKLKKSYEKSEEESNRKFPGSTLSCQNLSKDTISKFYQGTTRNSEFKWDELLVLSCEKECEAMIKTSDVHTVLQAEAPEKLKLVECIKKKLPQAKSCEAIAYHTARAQRKWNDPAHAKDDKKDFPQVGIKCINSGVETIDFEACVTFAENFSNFEMAQGVAYQGQSLVYQSKMIDAQAKVAEEKDAAKGALKGTKESLENQQDMYQQRSAIDAAKLAMLYSNYTDMPDIETVTTNCKGFQNQPAIMGQTSNDKECADLVIGSRSNYQVLQNQSQKDKMKAKMIKVATEMGSNAMLAALMGKRAGDIDKALAKVDAFKPIDPFIVSEEEAQTTYCKHNPGDEKCLTGGLERNIDGISDNIITFGEGATGTVYSNPSNNERNAIANGSDAVKAGKAVDSMGKTVNGLARDNSIDRASGASVKIGGTGSTGGGGGGSGGGASGGGGSSGGGATGEAAPQVAAQSKSPKYDGGDGSLSMMGGYGINKAKAQEKAEGNPFGKLFDKDGAKNGGTLNFRDLASVGGKKDNIFDMISKRYSSVNADKRLLEYELAK